MRSTATQYYAMDKHYRVLLVDDQPQMLELTSKAFEHRGFKVMSAESGETALELLEQGVPDLALIDIVMPGLDGIEVLSSIKKNRRTARIPVYMLSGHANRDNVETSAQHGAAGFISKSDMSIQTLLQKIDAMSATLDTLTLHDFEADTEAKIATRYTPPHIPIANDKEADAPATTQTTVPQPRHPFEDIELPSSWRVFASPLFDLCAHTQQPTIEQLETLIHNNSTLAKRIFKIASSKFKGDWEESTTLAKTIARLSPQKTFEIMLSETAITHLPITKCEGGISFSKFWFHSTATGLIAKALAGSLSLSEQACMQAYQIGLLHDIGKILLHNTYQEQYAALVAEAEVSERSLNQLEIESYCIDHAAMSETLLTYVGFDPRFAHIVKTHHQFADVYDAKEPQAQFRLILHLANLLSKQNHIGNSCNPLNDAASISDLLRQLNVSTAKVQNLVYECKRDLVWRFVY